MKILIRIPLSAVFHSFALLIAGSEFCRAASSSTVAGASPAGDLSIENRFIKVTVHEGRDITLTSQSSKRVFLAGVHPDVINLDDLGGCTRIVSAKDKVFGKGEAIEFDYQSSSTSSNIARIELYRDLPFALFRWTMHNNGQTATVTQKVRTLAAVVNLGKPAGDLRAFGTGGLEAATEENPGSYAWLAIAEPESRNGVVFGWLTDSRGSGVLFNKTINGPRGTNDLLVEVDAQIDYGRLRIEPGAAEPLETLAVGYFDDARLGLEAWADDVAKVYDVHLPPQPVGYCTWYSEPHGAASDEKHLAEQTEFAAKHLEPFGFSVIQIDDHWQAGVSKNGPRRNFTTHDPEGPYPDGMKPSVDHIKSLGLVPGIWFMPFAGTYYDPYFTNHLDWFVKTADGKPYETRWGGTCLDLTEPGARAHVWEVAHRISHTWGFQYFKIDGLWTGTATPLEYINTSYKDDGIGDAVLHNPKKTNLEAYRDGLRLVRRAAGGKVFIVGCNGPQNMRSYGGAFGLVDAMRVGPDNRANWSGLQRGPLFGTRHYFLHGRVWYNDPDPVYVRTNVPLDHAQLICSWVAISGQLNLSSEWLPSLPADRLDILKRTMPSHGLKPRPADLFETDFPSFWLLTDTRRPVRRDVIGVFNWESDDEKFDYSMAKLGLDANTEYVGFDYWANKVVRSIKGQLKLTVPAESCCVLAVRPVSDHPQLISTSRHITQGIVDVLDEKWDPATRTLSGVSKVVGGDPYELRVITGKQMVASVTASGRHTTSVFKQQNDLARITLNSTDNREIKWQVRFK
jgi:hypothetical protein